MGAVSADFPSEELLSEPGPLTGQAPGGHGLNVQEGVWSIEYAALCKLVLLT